MRKSYLMLGSLGLVLCGAAMYGSPAEAAAPAAAPDVPAQNIREYVPAQGKNCDGSWNNHRQNRQHSFHHRNRHESDCKKNCDRCKDGKDCECNCGNACSRDNNGHDRKGECGRLESRQCGS